MMSVSRCISLQRPISSVVSSVASLSTTPVAASAPIARVLHLTPKPVVLAAKKADLHTSAPLSANKDYYKALGVEKKADAKAIKKAYFNLAKKYHPDVNKTKEAESKFQEISEAYEVLSDDTKRQQYDTFGTDMGAGMGRGGAANGAGGAQWNYQTHADVNEIFRRAFGFGKGGINWNMNFAESQYGSDRTEELVLDLSFEEAVRGTTKNVNVRVIEDCFKCKGTAVEPGYKKVSCPYCNGTGMQTQKLQGGYFFQQPCGRCSGSGQYNKNPCQECEGHGSTVQRQQISLQVPAGTHDKETIRYQTGKTNVLVHFNVARSNKFTRQGDDIYVDVEVTVAQAILGGTVRVPGIYEDTSIQITPGTGSHTKLRLSGKGVKRANAYGSGDQYINVRIAVPKYLNDEQRRLMKAWAATDKPKSGSVRGVEEEVKKEAPKKSTKASKSEEPKEEKSDKEATGKKEKEEENKKKEEPKESKTEEPNETKAEEKKKAANS
ncbi:hypothetical protein PMAYCL1PPCAC_14020 [Pristionchus mayeri]|uniref:Dnj-10 n=1 Tax=Pristionchus mayeri TaxID=1317129 RepID=A0AAN4ZTZ1_9BILA|nr:hypothetical protein PMAYCL1PPCAC_14020 [Pristionchus mayeri]